jgi:chromosome segregation protein
VHCLNFKGIHLYGFKSFADRLDIRFEGGFTGIVGPNGCGKSNVADAIRWVLGEQSPKKLRGSSMQDVIFNGTDNRGSLSYCEVTLVFDNTSKIFNVNFDEVAISRKLYRNGESDYLINNVSCRLKDITDMLRDTGLGRDGLAIIGQGRVEDIVSAKPEDRRKVFEEAAGIARLKSKKRESELKLARHRANLERINYILIELERQLGPLKRQAQDAEKFIELSKQLKYQEINHFIYKSENANTVKNDIDIKIKGINEEIESLKQELMRASEEYSTKMSEIGCFDEQLETLVSEQTRLLVGVEKLAGEGKVLSERIKNNKDIISGLNSAVTRLQGDIEELNTSINNASHRRINTLREIDSKNKELEDVTDKYLSIEEELIQSENKLEQHNQFIFSSMDKLSDIKANMSKLTTERDNLIEQAAELDKEQALSREKLEDTLKAKQRYDAEIALVDKSISECQAKIQALKADYQVKRSKLSELNRSLMELNGRKTSLETRSRLLVNMKNSYDNYQIAVKKVMQDAQIDKDLSACIEGVVAELIKVPAKYEIAIETALGAALQNIVTPTQQDAAYVVDYLKKNRYGRITFLPLNSFKSARLDPIYSTALRENGVIGVASDVVETDSKYRPVIDGLLAKTVIVNNIDDAIRLSNKYRHGFKIVTLEGEVFSTAGSITGGSRKSEKAEILSRERDIEAILKQVQEANAEYKRLQDDVKKSGETLEKVLDEIKEIEELIQKKEVLKASLNEKIIIEAKLYDDTVVNIDLRQSKLDVINDRIREINEQKKYIEKMEEDAKNDKSSADKEALESKSIKDNKKALRDSLFNKQSEIKLEIKEKENLVAAIDSDIIRYKEEIVKAEFQINENRAKIQEIRDKMKSDETALEKILLENSDNAEIAAIKEKIESVGISKKRLQDELLELDFRKGELNGRINDATGRLIREEARLNKIDTDLQNMRDMIFEQYELDFDALLELKDPEFSSSKAQSEISKLKKEINALGVVNINAIEDYKEIGARYEDLNGQKNDLTKAEEDLLKIIQELTDEMVIKFKTEFEKINHNFKNVFKELFGGGRAELILEEDAEDPLEAGIEIKAEPPGKKMQNISLLSGGERALIAIGILFAILKSRPMPFCVLDEIEAALDDSNVKVFASYLRRFSKETQFIVITHRKPTMELADALYGVTMEEKGVSKMVSVKLHEAIKSAETFKSENIA